MGVDISEQTSFGKVFKIPKLKSQVALHRLIKNLLIPPIMSS